MEILGMPEWLFWLVFAVVLLYGMVLAGIVLGRAGVNPMWALAPTLAILLPILDLRLSVFTMLILVPAMVWRFALMRWPPIDAHASPDQTSVSKNSVT